MLHFFVHLQPFILFPKKVFNVVEVSEPELGDHPVKVILLWWMRGFWLAPRHWVRSPRVVVRRRSPKKPPVFKSSAKTKVGRHWFLFSVFGWF